MDEHTVGAGRFDSPRDLILVSTVVFSLLNLLSTFFFCCIPIVLPVWTAEASLLMIATAFGPGPFWRRFAIGLALFSFLVLCQFAFVALITWNLMFLLEVALVLIPSWILCMTPLWLIRLVFDWQIIDRRSASTSRVSIMDLLFATAVVAFAMTCLRESSLIKSWADSLEHQGPAGWLPSGMVMIALFGAYLAVVTAGTVAILGMRKNLLPTRIAWFSLATLIPPLLVIAIIEAPSVLMLSSIFLLFWGTVHHLIVFSVMREFELLGFRAVLGTPRRSPRKPSTANGPLEHFDSIGQ